MNFKKDFSKIYKKELASCIKKTAFFSLLISGFVLTIVSLVFWYFDIKKIWIAITAFVLVEAGLFMLFFKIFEPTDYSISKRLDDLGLKQRVITMVQYQNDDSLMAKIQRSNALEHINKVNLDMLKVAIPTVVIVFTSIAIALGAGATTVAALGAKGIIPTGKKTIEEIIPEIINQYEINYDVSGEGYIDGDLFQVIEEGKDGEFVLAVEAEGYVFDSWSDGNTSPSRLEAAVTKDMYLIAKFVPLGDEGQDGEGEGEGSGQDGQPGDEDTSDRPGEEGEGQGDGQPQPGGQEGGGTYTPTNQVIDGETYYGDAVYQNAYDDAMSQMQEDSGMSDDSKEVIGDYYANIKK